MNLIQATRQAIKLAGVVWLLSCIAMAAAAAPDTLGYQGRLTNGGVAVNGNVTVTFRLYSVASGGTALWTEANSVAVANGLYSVILGQSTAFPGSLFTQPLWLGVSLNADPEMTPRQPLTSTPYSQRAKSADSANYASALSVTPTLCPTGQAARGITTAGNATSCVAIGSGTVTSVGTGTGLTGGPITGTGTLSLAPTYQLPQGCGSGQIPKWSGSAWACQADASGSGTVTSVTAGAGLTGGTITGSGTVAIDPNAAVLTGNYLKRGGNALGATAVLGTTDNNAVEIHVNNERIIRIEPNASGPNIVAGDPGNSVGAHYGQTVAGGYNNGVNGNFGTASGGYGNTASGIASTVAGGATNTAGGTASIVSGGDVNVASGDYSTVAGGLTNTASGEYSTVAGGGANTANGLRSTVAGGHMNVAQGDHSFVAGTRAKANHANSFVWGGDPNNDTVSQEAGDFVVYAPGGVRLYAGPLGAGGCAMFNGTSGWGCASDRALKQDIVAVDAKEMLNRVLALPVSSWSFRTSPEARHVGPMAQDFMAAFHLGIDDKTISTMDEGGVALAAIQGLAQVQKETDARLNAKDAEISALKQRLAVVERTQYAEMAALKQSLADLRAALETTATRNSSLALHQ
jgi:hypothetical protein